MHPCNNTFKSGPPETLLTRKQVEELLDVSRATIYRWLKSNAAFPKQIRLYPNKKKSAVRWRLSELLAYITASTVCTSSTAEATDPNFLVKGLRE